jgi:hypothetical protein
MDKAHQSQQLLTILISLSLVILIISACQRNPQTSCQGIDKFNRTKWCQLADLMTFPNRNCMVDDLVQNYNLKEKRLNQIIDLLGEPQYPLDSTLEMGYKIEEEFGSDIDPIYTKTLLIQFNRDTLVKGFEIKEWKK